MKDFELKYCFIGLTSWISPNTIDWIRSIYFSLFGSTMLTYSLKYTTLSGCTKLIFGVGVFCFFLGLLFSIVIADRFKKYEKNYDGQPEDTKLNTNTRKYYYNQEIDTKYPLVRQVEHFLFLFLLVPAILCIFCAGANMEMQSMKSSTESKILLNVVKSDIQQIDSILQVSSNNDKRNRLFQDSLHSIKNYIGNKEKQIDSLKKVIKNKTFRKNL